MITNIKSAVNGTIHDNAIKSPKENQADQLKDIKSKLAIDDWDLPEAILKKYKSIGIKNIFEWQAECLMTGNALDGGNLIYSAPTSAGKTLVAELLMLKRVLETRKKAIMILPYISVAKEKLKHLQWFANDLNIRVDGFIGNANPAGGFNSVDIAICTIEKANSLLNRLIEDNKASDLGVMVIDELHMVGDSSRGYLLELLLTKIKYLSVKYESKNYSIQIIGMSATLPNLNLLAKWLDASLYQTDYRPVPLIECIKYGPVIFDNQLKKQRDIEINKAIENDQDLLLNLTYETIRLKYGVLIFCPTKQRCETLAENVARMVYKIEKSGTETIISENKEQIVSVIEQLRRTPAGIDSQLAKCISYGTAFHHAGLTMEERDIIESAFKQGIILVIVATSTLSSGVNLPARRVIIRTPIFNGHLLDTMTYRQMIGRAGRKGIDTIGESILMCNNVNEKRSGEELIKSQLAPIKSCLTMNMSLTSSIKRAILEIVVSGVAQELNDLVKYASCTLLSAEIQLQSSENGSSTTSTSEQSNSIEQCIDWLIKNSFITKVKVKPDGVSEKEIYKATPLGNAVLASAMAPDEGLVIFDELQKALQCFVLENELQLIYEVTPINISEYWSTSASTIDWNYYLSVLENFSNDKKRVANLVGVRESFIIKMIRGKSVATDADKKLQKIHLRFFTALILNDLVNEVPFSELTEKYKCPKGFLQSLQQSSATYSGMITTFCNRLGWHSLELLVNQFQARLQFGVHRELVDLVRVSLLNSYRARLLYNTGYTNIAALAKAEPQQVEKVFRSALPFKTNSNEEQKFDTKCIWSDGKAYTNWDAALTIIDEAKCLVKNDVEALGLRLADGREFEQTTRFESQIVKVNEKCAVENSRVEEKIQAPEEAPKDKEIEEGESPVVDVSVNIEPKLQQQRPIEESQTDEETTEDLPVVDDSIDEEPIQLQQQQKSNKNSTIHNLSTSMLGLSLNDSDLAAAMEMVHQITSNKIEMPITQLPQGNQQLSESQSASFMDNLDMIRLATEYDKKLHYQNSVEGNKENQNPSQSKAVDSTVLTDEMLEICQMYEKNAIQTPKPLTNRRKSDYWESTTKLMQSPRLSCVEKESTVQQTKTPKQESKHHSQRVRTLLALLPTATTATESVFINELNSKSDFESFLNYIKNFKSFISISLACEVYSNYKNITENKAQFKIMQNIMQKIEKSDQHEDSKNFIYFDSEKNLNYKLQTILVGLYSTQTRLTHVYIIDLCDKYDVIGLLRQIFECESLLKILFFAKDQFKLLANVCNVEIKSPCYDPILAYWLLENKIVTIFDVKQKYCANNFDVEISENLRKVKHSYGSAQMTSSSLPMDLVKNAFVECLIGLNCMEKLKLKLQLECLWKYFTKIECETLLIAARMELTGIGFNDMELRKSTEIIENKMHELERKIYSLNNGRRFALTSPDDVARVLFVDLKLKPIVDPNAYVNRKPSKKIKHFSTAKIVLEKLSEQHEMPKLILEWRQINNALLKTVYPLERAKYFHKPLNMHRIHSNSDMSTVSGRIVLFDPCLQMIPKDFDVSVPFAISKHFQLAQNDASDDIEEFDDIQLNDFEKTLQIADDADDDDDSTSGNDPKYLISLRNSFIPCKNNLFLSADYCQLELRIMAHLCKDRGLQQIMNDTKNDAFLLLASKWLNQSVDKITDKQRQQTKQIVYGIIYGISPKTLSKFLNIDEAEAALFIETFKATFSGLKQYIADQIEFCKKNSYVETVKKRKRYLPNINSTNVYVRAQAERQAINTIVQGSASDLVKLSMIQIDKSLKKRYPTINGYLTKQQPSDINGAYMVLQMHDELIYEINENDLDIVYDIVKYNMENSINFDVKMPVKIKVGKTWGSLKPYNK